MREGPAPVFVVGRFPPPLDGQALATRRLASLLAPAREVHALDLNPGGEAFVQSRVRFRPGAAWHFLRQRRRLRRALAVRPGAPVVWTSISPTPLGHFRDVLTVAPALGRRPVYAVVHNGGFDAVFRRPLTAPTARRLARRLRGVVFLDDALAERCATWLPAEKRVVIPNTIDEALIAAEDELARKWERRRAGGPLRLLFLSHMIPSKGYMDVLEAVARLHARGVAVRADFAGRWDSAEGQRAFDRAVAAHGLGGVVTHHGGLSDPARIRALHLRADAFLLPTYYPTEAQPLTIIEALSAGTPVVATAHAGIPGMVAEGEQALFVPPRDPAALAEAVERLLPYARWRSLAEGARARFDATFSPGAVRARWLDLLAPPV